MLRESALSYVYTAFSSEKTSVYQHQRCPIVLSIATLRVFDKISKVFVIDRTPENHDWLGFPKKLNFEVLTDVTSFNHLPPIQHRLADIKHLLHHFGRNIVFCDADVFWTAPYKPIMVEDKLSLVIQPRGDYEYVNSGFFYFRKGTAGHEMFEIWEDTLMNWRSDTELVPFLTRFYGVESESNIGDEGIMGYLINKAGMRDKVQNSEEPTLYGGSMESPTRLAHLLSCLHPDKISLAFRISEIRSVLRSVLTPEDYSNFGEYNSLIKLSHLSHTSL